MVKFSILFSIQVHFLFETGKQTFCIHSEITSRYIERDFYMLEYLSSNLRVKEVCGFSKNKVISLDSIQSFL